MKISDIIKTANSNLLRSKIRTLLTVVSIIVGALTLTLTVGIKSGISAYIDKQLGNIGAENILVVQPKFEESFGGGPKKYDPNKNSSSGGPLNIPSLNNEDIKSIAKIDGITKVEPTIMGQIDYAQTKDSDKYIMNINSYVTDTNLDLLAGKLPDNQADNNQVILPEEYIKAFKLENNEHAIGKELIFNTTNIATSKKNEIKAKIVGVQANSLMSSDGASGNTHLMEALHESVTKGLPDNIKDTYYSAVATLKDSGDINKVNQIKDKLKKKDYNAQTVKDQIGIINKVINAITAVLIFFGAIALFAASFGIINTLYMSVQERTKEIGLMKAMGMSRKKVFLLFSVEAILIGFWGSFIGVILAILVGKIANEYATKHFLQYFSGFNLTEFPVASVLIIMLIVMFISFLAGTLPSRKASKQDAIEALRYE